MTTTPTVFNFNSQEIRTIILNSGLWFIAEDICNALGLKNVSMALKPLDEDERSKFNLGRQGEVNIISESGMYTLVLRSRDAVKQGSIQHKFRKWVTNEVLPAIRKTGSYTAENTKTSKSTADDRTPLRDAINLLVSKKHILYPEAYSYVHQRFNVKHIDELEPSEITTAVEYVHKLALEGELLEAELIYTLKLSDEELCSLAWLWRAADFMRNRIEEVEAPLRALNSGYAASFYSMSREYKRVLQRSKIILERETRDINPHPTWMSHSNWRYALESLRN